VRLFLAIELPAEVRQRLAEVQERLQASCRGWRWVRPDGIHLTLRFLGEVAEERDRRLRDTWRGAAAAGGPFVLGLGGVGRFPPRGRPRVLWLGIDELEPGQRLEALARRLEAAARADGFSAEGRAFRPHLTLARARRNERPVGPEEGACGGGPTRFAVTELTLFRSELLRSGARYTSLERFPLLMSRDRDGTLESPAGAG